MLLYIIRHADPIYSPDSLTELGLKQADALAERLAVNGLDKVYSSPNMRAQMTAKPTCDLLGLKYTVENWMSEDLAWRDFACETENGGGMYWAIFGQTTKLKYDETIKSGGEWHESKILSKTNAKNGYKRIIDCSDEFIGRLGYKRIENNGYEIINANNDRVAAFCHQGFGTTWLSHLLEIPPHLFWPSFDMSHSSVTILEFQNYKNGRTSPKCLCLSDMSHIYKSSLPFKYNNYLDI